MSGPTAQSVEPIHFSDRFTTIPKVREVCPAGVPSHLIPTYAALADYANNTTGECYPKWETLARILGKALRTIQRHVHHLAALGLVQFLDQPDEGGILEQPLERRRDDLGRYVSFRVRLPHIAVAAARIRERREANQRRYEETKRRRQESRERRRRHRLSKQSGEKKPGPTSPRDRELVEVERELDALGEARYAWFFGDEAPPEQAARVRELEQRRAQLRSRNLQEGYEWLFEEHPQPHETPATDPQNPPPTEHGRAPGEDGGRCALPSHVEDPAWLSPDPQPDPHPEAATLLDAPFSSNRSTGHGCPVAPIYATSRQNHSPPNPPTGGDSTPQDPGSSPDRDAPFLGAGGVAGDASRSVPIANPRPSPGVACWSELVATLRASLPDGDDLPSFFGLCRDATLHARPGEAIRLVVQLHEAPIRDIHWRKVGNSADEVRRFSADLARLWREISGSPHALLELL